MVKRNKLIYCVSCKHKTATNNLHTATAHNAQRTPMAKGNCSSCGTRKTEFLSRRSGKGIWDSIKSAASKAFHVGKSLYNNEDVRNAVKKYGPQAVEYAKKRYGGKLRRRRKIDHYAGALHGPGRRGGSVRSAVIRPPFMTIY